MPIIGRTDGWGNSVELRHLRTFRVVARTLNLTKAAAELHYAQSSVTEQIQALEAQLDTQLFDRSGRRIRLTAAGERLIAYADQVLTLVEEAKAAMDVDPGEPAGEIVVGALETLCVQRIPALFTSYRTRWPQVRISVREGGRGELYGAVQRGEMDACLTFGAPPADPTLASETLAHDRLMVIAPPGHPFTARTEIRVDDLHGVGFLATPQGCGFRSMLDDVVPGPVIEAEVGSLAALSNCVASGMGCGLVPELATHDRAITAVPLRGMASPVTMTWLRRQQNKASLSALRTTARDVFAAEERSGLS